MGLTGPEALRDLSTACGYVGTGVVQSGATGVFLDRLLFSRQHPLLLRCEIGGFHPSWNASLGRPVGTWPGLDRFPLLAVVVLALEAFDLREKSSADQIREGPRSFLIRGEGVHQSCTSTIGFLSRHEEPNLRFGCGFPRGRSRLLD